MLLHYRPLTEKRNKTSPILRAIITLKSWKALNLGSSLTGQTLDYMQFLDHLWQLKEPQQSSHQLRHEAIYKFYMFPPSPTTCHSQNTSQISKVSIHTKGYTCRDINSFLTKTPDSSPPDKIPTFQLQNEPFLWGCHKVITLSFRWKKRNILKEEVKLETANEWKCGRGKCHPRCSLWTSCILQTDWNRSHSQPKIQKLVKKLSGSL